MSRFKRNTYLLGDNISYTISDLIEKIRSGVIRIPGFQRTFVWEPEVSAKLIDSIHRGYPFGSLLLWRTRNQLATEKNIGGFPLPNPEELYPVDYVLDGQQRLTTLFATFQVDIASPGEDPESWLPIYYDFESDSDHQESRFVALQQTEINPDRHFPLNCFFDPVGFHEKAGTLTADRVTEIVKVQQKFTSAQIPIQTFESEDRESVAIVFERINHLGVPLDVFQLLTAWTWSEDFDLQEQFLSIGVEFESFGFSNIGEDSDLLLRCTAAVLKQDPSASSLISVSGASVRDQFETVKKALRKTVDFLRSELKIKHISQVPYTSMIIPLVAYFSIDQGKPLPDKDRKQLLNWFWRTSFSHRYSGNPYRNIKQDVEHASALRGGKEWSLSYISSTVEPDYFISRAYRRGSVASRALILLLANNTPKSFISGNTIDLDQVLFEANRKEIHHCFPKAYLTKNGIESRNDVINCLANQAIISRSDNRSISDQAPSLYRKMMPADISPISESAFLPNALFNDDWVTFVQERARMLSNRATALCEH